MQPCDESFANAITADGRLIPGGCGSPCFSIPEGNLLTNVVAASTDGEILPGVAYDPQGRQVSFVLQLPVSAYGL